MVAYCRHSLSNHNLQLISMNRINRMNRPAEGQQGLLWPNPLETCQSLLGSWVRGGVKKEA